VILFIAFCLVIGIASIAIGIKNKELDPIFKVPQQLARKMNPPQQPLTFSWDNCGSSGEPVQLASLAVGPDPIVLGNNITVSFAAKMGNNIVAGSGFSAGVTIEKKIFGIWTEIPCVDSVGSCSYDDFCSLFKPHPNGCGPILEEYKLPCDCPFNTGSYSMPTTSIKTKNPNLSWLTDGDFYLKGQIFDSGGNEWACYEVYASLSSS